jgi:ribosomal protein S18 acetylase RimI-like enzyme
VLAVHVDPDVTGRGVGGALLDRAVEELASAGYDLATLWVVTGN